MPHVLPSFLGMVFSRLRFAQGRKVRFHTATDLVTQLVQYREERRLQRLQKQLQRLDLTVLAHLELKPLVSLCHVEIAQALNNSPISLLLILSSGVSMGRWE